VGVGYIFIPASLNRRDGALPSNKIGGPTLAKTARMGHPEKQRRTRKPRFAFRAKLTAVKKKAAPPIGRRRWKHFREKCRGEIQAATLRTES